MRAPVSSGESEQGSRAMVYQTRNESKKYTSLELSTKVCFLEPSPNTHYFVFTAMFLLQAD